MGAFCIDSTSTIRKRGKPDEPWFDCIRRREYRGGMTSCWQESTKFMASRVTFEDLARTVHEGLAQVNRRLDSLEDQMERVELRLDQCAYRFALVELQHRVGTIEHQIGLGK